MRHRAALSRTERSLRSRLHKLLDDADGLVHGSLIRMARTCGNPRCKCAVKGEKHVSLYLGQTRKGKTRMKYIPKAWDPNSTEFCLFLPLGCRKWLICKGATF